VIAILGGIAAALSWGTATVSSSRASRVVGATSTLAGVMLVGLAVSLPIALASGLPSYLDAEHVGWLAVAGVGNVLGLLLEYRGLRLGKVGVVAALASTEGALTAVIAIVLGEPVSVATAFTLAVIAIGVALASIGPDEVIAATASASASARPAHEAHEGRARAAAAYGIGAALTFAVSLYATARLGEVVSVPWVLASVRGVGVLGVAVPAAVVGRLRFRRSVMPNIALSGVLELAGFAAFTFGSRHSIAVTAVLASQFAALAAVGAFVLFRERLARVQLVGVATILVGVGVLAGVRG
jgi:drug/metabolite transporter (DMT)-like permease